MPVGYKWDGSVRLWSQTEEVQLELVLSAKKCDKSHGKTFFFRENLFREAKMIGYQAEASVRTFLYDRINGRVVQDNERLYQAKAYLRPWFELLYMIRSMGE